MPSYNAAASPNAVYNQELADQISGARPIVGQTRYWQQYDRRHPFKSSGDAQKDRSNRQIRLDLERRYPDGPPDGYEFGDYGTINQTLGRQIRNFGIASIPLAALVTGGLLAPALSGGSAAAAGAGGGASSGIAGGAGLVVQGAAGAAPVSSAYSWLSPLLKTVVPVAGGIAGTILQNNALNDASKLEQDALDKALAAEKERED